MAMDSRLSHLPEGVLPVAIFERRAGHRCRRSVTLGGIRTGTLIQTHTGLPL